MLALSTTLAKSRLASADLLKPLEHVVSTIKRERAGGSASTSASSGAPAGGRETAKDQARGHIAKELL